MPLGAARLTLLAKSQVTAAAEVIRKKISFSALEQVQIDTAQSQFGGASALFDGGTNDYITVDNHTQAYTDDFTFEGWFRWAALPGSGGYSMLAQHSSRGDYFA